MRDIESEIAALATTEALSIDQVYSEIKSATTDFLLNDSMVITVAGTNGKGSVIHGIEAVLKISKLSYAKFTSPHVHRFNERIVVDANEVTDDKLLSHLDRIKPLLQQFELNYYQITFLLALSIFKHYSPNIILLEVGLGGLYDAVNVIEPDIAVITSIDYDHMDVLGKTLDEIATQKLGVARKDKPLIICQENPPQVILNQTITGDMRLKGRDFIYPNDMPTPLMREDNAAGVIEVLKLISERYHISLPYETVLPAYQVPYRCQHVKHHCEIIFDVAHNPASVQNLCEHLQANKVGGRTLAVFQARADKDVDAMVSAIDQAVDCWFIEKNVEIPTAPAKICGCDSIKGAFLSALSEAAPEDRLVCFGSFVTISVLAAILEEEING